IRLRHRMNVAFPQPDGPMIAVTALGAIASPMPCSTWTSPNQAWRSLTRVPSATPSPHRAVTAARRDPRREADQEDQRDQHQGPRPGLAGAGGEGGDRGSGELERERGGRLDRGVGPEAGCRRPEEQRG